MEGKVKCSGCGWSWNKSDSSKKDMYVCHQCGKDNTMKNGGWLNKYDDGGPVQPNYNDASVSMSEDFVGLGYNTEGRNYSPAWGGQFQEGGKLNPLSPMQQVQQAVQPTPTVPYLQTKDPSEFYKSWIQSPEYERRQLLTGYSEGEDLYMPNAAETRESRLGAIEEMTPITYNTREPSKADPGISGSPSYVNINPSDYAGTSKKAIEAHELAHIAGAMGNRGQGTRKGGMSSREQEIFKESMLPMAEPKLSGAQGSKEREASKMVLEDFQHSQKPDEAKADLDALRFMMYDKGIYDITKGKKFTETDFQKAKQNLGNDRVFKRLENRMGKKNFVNLMNTIASTDTQEEAPIAMGGMSIPGSVGFSYARTAGSAPSKGKYAKKTMASAQKGKQVQKGVDSTLENIFEVVDPTGVSSWDDVYQSYQKSGMSPETKLEILGALPILGKVGKAGKLLGPALSAGQTNKRLKTNAKLVSNVMQSIPYIGRGTDATQAVQQFSDVPFFPTAPPAGVGQFGRYAGMPSMDLEKKQYGGEIPSAQNGIMSPMLLARNVLNYFYPSEEAAPAVEAAPSDYKKGLTNELLQRQAYKESTFNPAAVSPAGYKGIAQIGEGVLKDYSNKKGGKKLDPFNPEDAVELQKFAMDDLYNASFINKPNQPDSVRIAKTLAAYNWGRGNLANYLNDQKSKGVDIYDSYDWLNNLPKETSDYVNKILLQEDPSFNKNYKKASTNPKYEEVTSLYDQKKFGGDIPSAQNGQEMRFYQNGLDWKPRSMQNGGEEEMYEGQQLPEFTITPYDEQYPFYQTLSPEQKKYINDEGPIGRGIRAIATTGKVGQTAKDISTPYRSVQEVASEVTGIPGTIRFSNDPVKNLKGAGKTLLDLGIAGSSAFSPTGYGSLGGYNPITKEELFNQENLEGTFNTIDALGLGSMMAAPLVKPTSAAARAVGKATREIAQPHLTSISNVANETLDAVQAINNVKKFEKLSMIDVPALPGIDKLKDVRNFGKELAELESKSKNASLSDLNSLREKYTKLSEQAKEFKSSNIFKLDDANKQSGLQTDYDIGLRLIDNKLNKLSNFKLDDFINNLKKQGANKVALETLRSNPDLALRYFDTVSSFSDSRMAEELITGDTLSALENFRTYPNSGKTTNFSPKKRSINSDRIDPITGDAQWSGSTDLKKVDNKLYEEDLGSDKFYSYPFYKNVGDKIVDAYSNLRLSGSPVISPMQRYSEAIELMPSLFADTYNVGSMLRQASRYIDETPDGLMFPAGSLSGDSYPLALNMMARELKNNPDSQLRLIGFGRSNELGFADKVNNPKLLQSELSQIIKGIEDVSGQRLPKPYIFGNNINQVMLPKFAISKGSTNKVIQDYLNNTSIADRLGVKRPVREVSPNPTTPISNPPQTINFDPTDYDFDTNFKNGGVTKDNQGYWNPNNWGQPVEIDSNDITMEGVYEPLIGVSDTGDTKLMKPGKNYKFKGKKVTEFPVAKLGINQLDAQPMKKLNQLLNFTNNPDKDNWLDKYN